MGTPGPAPEVGLDETLEVFAALEQPSTPLTASEVAEELDCTRETARPALDRLSDRGTLATKETGANDRIWWWPVSSRGGAAGDDPDDRSEHAEFGDFTSEVEDYAIFVLDPDGTVATWNEGARRIKGYERSEIVGEHFSTFYTEEDVEAGIPQENVAAAIAAGRVEDEGWRVRSDGTEFWANVVITAIRDDDGELQGFTKVTRDMTERREYEQRLHHQRKRVEKLVQTAPIPIAVQDAEGETVMANERAQNTLGLTEQEFVEGPENEDEWTVYDADGEPIEAHETPSARVLATGEPVYDEEIAIETPEGERTWFSINAAPFTGNEENEAQVVIAGEDVTGLKERERELEAELSEVLGRVSDAFYALDDDWRFTHVNDRAADVLDHSREELLGASIWEVFPDYRGSAVSEEFRAALDTQESRDFEEHFEATDRWFEFNVYPSETGLSVYFQDVSERKERERGLERYERMVENVPVGVYRNTPGPDGEFVEANPAVASIFGADSVDELLEHDVSDLYADPDQRPEFSERLEEEGIVVNVELEQETLDGETIWISVTAIRTEEDGEVYFDGIVEDVTERREYERELEQYEVLLTESRDVSVVMDPDGTFQFVTPSMAGVLGHEPEELVGENAFDLVHPEDRERVIAEYSRLASDPQAEPTVEYRFEHADGHWVYLESRGRNLLDDPIVEGIVVYSRDVTERRRREQRLEESQRQLSTLMDNVPGMVYRCRNEPEWPMEFVSEGCRDLTGYDPGRLERGEVSYGGAVVHEEDREALWDDVQRGLEEDGTFLVTYRIVTDDGDVRWVRERGRHVPTEGENDDAIEGVIIDVTDRKRLESELDEVFGRVTDAFFALDENWEFTYVNEKAHGILAPEGRRLVGENVWEEFPDAIGRSFRDEYERAMYEQETVTFEEYYPEPLGAWFDVTAYPSDTGLSVYFRDVTEQKEAQRQLEAERDMFAEGPAIVFRWGTAAADGWPVEYVSDNVEDVLGYTPEALTSAGVHYSDLLLEEEIDRIASEVESAVESGADRFTHEPYRVETGDDDVRWVKDTTKIVRNEAGEVDHFLGYLVDVTERKEQERELARYETIVETVNDGIYVVDEDGRFTMVNEAYAEMTGYDREELLGEEVSLVVDGPVGREAKEIEEQLIDGDVADPVIEAELETASGDRIPSEATFATLPSRDEEGGRRIGVARDVTDRKEYERELERKERRYQAVFEDPNILVGLLEPDGTVLDINDTAMEYVDAELADVVGEQFAETPWWTGDDDVEADVREWVERAAAGEYVDFEADLTRPGGKRYVLSGYFRPVTNDDGEVVSIIVSDRDITEQKEYQRELERSEQRYRTLVENFPNGAVGLVDEDLRYQTVGGNPVDRKSEAASDLEGKTIREALDPEFADAVEPHYRAALEGEASTFEVDLGDTVTQMQTYPVRDDDGEVFAALGMSQDITERVERERYLEDAKSRLEAATAAGAVGTWEWDVQEDEMVANPSFAETFGLDPDVTTEGLPLDRFVERIHEDDRERVERQIEKAVEERGEYETEYRVRDADGELRWVVARGYVETDEDGTLTTFPGALTDITKRKEYQRRIEESERRYRTLIENFPGGAVGLFDEDLTYIAVGGELLEEADIPREERIGQNVREIYPEELADEVEPHFQAALEGETNTFETEFHDRHLRATVLPVTDADDEAFAGMLVVQDITERREARQELRESEAKFRMIAENLEEVVWMATPDAEEIVYLNPAFEKVWGIDRQQLYDESLSFIDRVHPEEREHVEEEFTSLPEEDFDEEFRILRPDGEERWVNARGIQVTDGESEMTRIVGIGKDVTERVERERELERVLDLLEKTERIADVGGWEIDVDTEEVFWTDHVFDILDVDYDEEPPLDEALDMYHGEDQPIVEDAVEEALAEGDSFDVEVRLAGEETGWIRLQGDPETEGDEVVSFRGAAQDVTERVERERELEESERRYRTLAENFPNGAAGVFDADLRYTLAGGAMLGEGLPPAEELEDDRMPDVFPEDVAEDLEPIFRAAVEDGETGTTTTEFGGRDWQVWTTPLRDADGEVFAGLSLAQDITERIERERRLEELVDKLEESNERLERFAYVASHDLQEPLRMISNYLQLLERRYRDELDSDAEEFIDFAVDGAERMRDMIDDLLAYSRLDTEAEPFEPVEVGTVVETVRDDLQLRIEETDAQITVEDLPTVEADENQLEMVFQNLVSNAIKYSGDEPPRIEIGADRRDDEWVFRVADEGIGMDPEHAEDVFDVFKRLHTQDEYSGTGIGLAMCKKIVRHHGGRIWVESEPGDGSTFYFTVPAGEGRSAETELMTQADQPPVDAGERGTDE